MKKVVILGAGLATRLYPITHHIPKVLVNYKQHTILHHLYNIYHRSGAQEIIVVVHSKFAKQVREYAKLFKLDVIVETVDEAYGSAYAISQIGNRINGHNVVFNWCDVIPQFDSFSWDHDCIYTFGDECRYNFDGNELNETGGTGGNVVGIYQYRDFFIDKFDDKDEANEYFKGRDFVELLDVKDSFYQDELIGLIDLGDKPKLQNAHKHLELNREFNSVTFSGDVVFKAALNEKGRELQAEELSWYDHVDSPALPKIIDRRNTPNACNFKMERIHGNPMFKVYKPELLDEILETLKFPEIGCKVTYETKARDYQYEVIDKVLARCSEIQGVIDSFGKIRFVNGTRIGRLKTMLQQAYSHLIYESIHNNYHIIHGDPNFSNLMLDDSGVRLIDPRGYFGKTKLFGPRIYDEAKVLYALSGYDEFNSDPMWGGLSINGAEATVKINELDSFYNKNFNVFHRLWVAVIWIALAGYFKNNPIKSVSAYYYGMHLLTRTLDESGRRLRNGGVSHDTGLVTAMLKTKNPDKWVLTDKETGQKYRPNKELDGFDWEKI